MNHRDRNTHNAGFNIGYISRGYKPRETFNGFRFSVTVIVLVVIVCVGARFIGLV